MYSDTLNFFDVLFYVSLACISGWVFIWPIMFSAGQHAVILHVGALTTLVVLLVSLTGMVVIRIRARPGRNSDR